MVTQNQVIKLVIHGEKFLLSVSKILLSKIVRSVSRGIASKNLPSSDIKLLLSKMVKTLIAG